jgi:hypothetical protein
MPSDIRFTLIDPNGLGAAFPYKGALPKVRSAARSIADELGEVLDDIRRINEQVVGHADRLLNLNADQRAGEVFEVVAIVDFPKAFTKDPRSVESIVKVANSGPRAGRHLILELSVDSSMPHDFSTDEFENAVVIDCREAAVEVDALPDGRAQRELIERAVNKSRGQQKSSDWESAVKPETYFSGSASSLVETPIGERLRMWFGDDSEGKPSAHAMIAGQTGAGKSYLLHVLITGLAARYSPDELQFVLIDGKQGVEFEAYRDLPHAQIVCLRTSPVMARSVLADFVTEMESRYAQFQDVGAVKIGDFREKTGKKIARRVLVVDEYQQLLEGDPELGGQLLLKLLEKGRAAGTHVVLGSQVFAVQGLPPSALTHIHLRASMSLAQDYVQSLQVFGPEGKRLIRELEVSGQVVINDESGRDGANLRGAVARFRRDGEVDTLRDAIDEIIEAAGRPGSPVVLSGRTAATLSQNPFLAAWNGQSISPATLQEVARRPEREGGFGVASWTTADYPVALWLGRKFDVHGHALCVLRRAPMQNLLVLGGQTAARNRMLASALIGLAAMQNLQNLELVCIDGLRAEVPGGGMIKDALDRLGKLGAKVSILAPDSTDVVLTRLSERALSGEPSDSTTILIIAEPDYVYELHSGADRFAPVAAGPGASLRNILAKGAQHGIHTIVTASGLAAFSTILAPSRDARFFNHRATQQMNEDDSMSLFASLAGARIGVMTDHPNATMLVDAVQGMRDAVLFHSYAASQDIHKGEALQDLQREFDQVLFKVLENVA